MKKLSAACLALVACVALPSVASAEATAKNTIYAELLGPGGIYSINYDRLLTDAVAGRIGFSYFSFGATAGDVSSEATIMFIPVTVSYIGVGSDTHHLELGGGPTLVVASGTVSSDSSFASGSGVGAFGSILAGYRLQPADGGFNFRVGLSPLFGAGGFVPWGYLSLGGTF